MGSKNSPSIFQRAMQDMLRDLDFCHCYIDDVIVASESPEEHLHHLRILFERLRSSKVLAKGTKAKLFRTNVDFLGHVIGADGVAPTPEKGRSSSKLANPQLSVQHQGIHGPRRLLP
jgi:hypothetical protein